MQVLTIRVPKKWHARLKLLAAERAISISDLVRIYLREALYDRTPRQ